VEQAFHGRPVEGHDIAMTISAGLATFPDDGLHADELLARADEALYGAKHAGRNRVCVHYREKRSALRFPVKSGTVVSIAGAKASGARPVNLSRTGMLLAALAGLSVADRVSLRFERRAGSGADEDCSVSGQVVRVVADPSRPAEAQIGVAFDDPIPEGQLAARISLSRASVSRPRGADR
jgi:hypothetical protein